MNKKVLIGIGIVIFLIIKFSISDRSKQFNNISTNQQVDKKVQQEEFLKLYRIALSGIKLSNSMFYSTHNLLNKADRASMYNLLKSSEEAHEKLTVSLKTASVDIDKTHPSLKEYRKDIAQSFDELADVFAHRQLEARYLADYLNTGNLESYRKTTNEMEGTGETMSNAVSRLVFGVGKKLDMDTNSLDEEYQKINVEVKQEFENRFGKVTQ